MASSGCLQRYPKPDPENRGRAGLNLSLSCLPIRRIISRGEISMRRFNRLTIVGTLLCGAALTSVVIQSQQPIPRSEWRYYGGDKGYTRYSSLDQINRNNVKNLRIAWRRPAVNARLTQAFPDLRPSAYLRSTPIMIDGVLYTQDGHGLVIAIDGETGRTIWEQQPATPTREDAAGSPTRGVDYWR